MTTLAEAEARVTKGDTQIRQRAASGLAVPPTWYAAFDGAVVELLACYEREHQTETQDYRATATGTACAALAAAEAEESPAHVALRQTAMPISAGVR